VALRETVRGIVSSLERITAELEKLASHTLHDAEALLHLTDGDAQSQSAHSSLAVARQPVVSGESSILLGDLLTEDSSNSTHHLTPLVIS
jgi:hypothetical protein